MKIDYELEIATKIAKEASATILDYYFKPNLAIETKEDSTIVTDADKAANEIIVNGLQSYFPSDGIVSEEMKDVEGNRTWYVDPIDGTRGFANHVDQFAIHIGLAREGKSVFGLVYKPITDEFYYGSSEGSYLVGPNAKFRFGTLYGEKQRLTTNKNPDLDNLKLIVNQGFMLQQLGRQVYDSLKPKSVLVNGSQGLRMMKIADGSHDAHVHVRLNCSSWDLCAPQAIVEGAGGYCKNIDGSDMTYHRQRLLDKLFVVAANEEVGEYVSSIVQKLM